MLSRIVRRSALPLAFVLWYAAAVAAQHPAEFSGRVVAVVDGDTIGVMRDGREVRVRLDGIDAPETRQEFSQRAKQFISDAVFGKTARVVQKDTDRYGRIVARVFADGRDLSVAIVQAGLAWHFIKYSDDPVLAEAEANARTRTLGLWSQPRPIPPWEFRDGGTAAAALPLPLKAPAVERAASLPATFLGNTQSRIVHTSTCPLLKQCKYCTREFSSVAEAVKTGYRPHGGNAGCIRN